MGAAAASASPAKTYDTIGAGEGQLNLIAWNGYVEDGTNDPNFDWVTAFEEQTGCKVTVKYADTSDEMVTLMRQGGGSTYDGVSASGDASNRLIAGGDVAAVDPSLFPEMSNVIAPLQPGGDRTKHYVVNGVQYGVPYMYGPELPDVQHRRREAGAHELGRGVRDDAERPAEPVRGQDHGLRRADLHRRRGDVPEGAPAGPRHHRSVRAHQDQLDAAVDLLKQQATMVKKYWALYTDEIDGFVNGSMVAGTAWPVNLSYAEADAPVDAVVPVRGRHRLGSTRG